MEAFFYEEKGGESYRSHPALNNRGNSPKTNYLMILFVDVILKQIFTMGKDFPWTRPETCPCCGNWKVWGHGFVSTIFQGFDTPLLLKRYRCPACGCVVILRPSSHFSRFQSSKHTIRSAIVHRINTGRWPPGSARSRQRHWLCNLKRQLKAHLTEKWKDGLVAAFDYLLTLGRTPVSRSI